MRSASKKQDPQSNSADLRSLNLLQVDTPGQLGLAFALAVFVHVMAVASASYYGEEAVQKNKTKIVVKVIHKKPPAPVLEKLKKEFVKKKEVKKKVDLTKKKKPPVVKKPVKVKNALPPPNPSTVKPTTKPQGNPPPLVFGLGKNSVVKGNGGSSGFSVRVGNTIMKEMELEYTNPDKVKVYHPVQLYTITKFPKLIKVVKPEYTKLAREKQIEGVVVLEVDIDEDGDVRYVKVLKKLGFGLDEAALEAVKQFKYRPASQGRVAVSVKKKVKMRFRLDD